MIINIVFAFPPKLLNLLKRSAQAIPIRILTKRVISGKIYLQVKMNFGWCHPKYRHEYWIAL